MHMMTGRTNKLTSFFFVFQVDSKSGKNLKYEVYSFYKLHYSANLMAVCLLHNADLEKLQEGLSSPWWR